MMQILIRLKNVLVRTYETLRRHIVRALASSDAKVTEKLPSLCKFLKSREEIDICTAFLRRCGYFPHSLECKNWDLAHIIPEIGDGNFLDMGSSDSYILKNLSLKKIKGELHGVDLRQPDVPIKGVHYVVGDLVATKFPANYFSNISCLSVIEHGVDFKKFSREAARLLKDGGRLFLTFDYWNPKVPSPIKMYGLEWQPLDETAMRQLIADCESNGLHLTEELDWRLGEQVINSDYYSPHPDMKYTFGLVVFEKRRTVN